MKPAMRQRITIKMPILDSKGKPTLDDYSRPKTESKTGVCRTREKANLLTNERLSIQDANDEIDVLPSFPYKVGAEVLYTTIQGVEKKGTIIGYTESTNITASKVYFRTLIVDEKS
ncbi:hypothetical protein [Staphylococcus hyicus]|uniref:hypothetical protein n=1 Tax=Staphylococcus hyicus TaxID=1284 RepID=UPI00211CED6F|nr:hypothetical protein [Staphylococcus hyicus]MCQ9290702.1 hypothetical protein [Staphylococcus hyicus]MCQ9305944.1 hypothetical protein [Staphylococcus hyicus]MCQ9308356.1 hypothetical protein [Staphylococcus hyicus]MCQ9310778.1 hypothetical protein [Staphylococcus hyicus]